MHEPLDPGRHYEFRIEQGAVSLTNHADDVLAFTGAQLLAIGRQDFDEAETLSAARRLLRVVLNYHIGGDGLQTRRVAAAMKRA